MRAAAKIDQLSILLLFVLALAESAAAATLEVRLEDDAERALVGEVLVLEPLERGLERSAKVKTDGSGRARFSEIAPGSYVLKVLGLRRDGLVRPEENPLAPPPRVTFTAVSEEQQLVFKIWRGSRVRVHLEVATEAHSAFQLTMTQLQTGKIIAAPLGRSKMIELVLPPGIWQTQVRAPDGWLLTGVSLDREPLRGHVVDLDVALAHHIRDLTFSFAAVSAIFGSVKVIGKGMPAVEARLVRPGNWIDAVRRRGGSSFEVVTAFPDPATGAFEMRLPDGLWRVALVGSSFETEPESLDLNLAPGAAGRADFVVQLNNGGDGRPPTLRPLNLAVRDPEGRPLASAFVEVWSRASSEPLASGRTSSTGLAFLLVPMRPGQESELAVVAGRADFLESRIVLDAEAQERAETTPIELVVPRGSELRFVVRDPEERPLRSALINLIKIDGPPPLQLEAPEFVAAKSGRALRSDLEGEAHAPGLYPGRYRLHFELAPDLPQARRIRLGLVLEDGTIAVEGTYEIELGADQIKELVLVAVPAASLSLELYCVDGWPLPQTVDVRLLDVDAKRPADPSGRTDPSASRESWNGMLLVGKNLNRLELGPLSVGDYRVALRPAAFDRFTWFFGGHDPATAQIVSIKDDEPLPGSDSDLGSALGRDNDLGELPIECGPAVDLKLRSLDRTPFPPLADLRTNARLLHASETQGVGLKPAVHKKVDHLEVRGLEPGQYRLELRLEHPHFLPEPELTWEIPLDLLRGRHQVLDLEVESLGGAISIVTSIVTGATGPEANRNVVAHGPAGQRREVALVDGRASLPALEPGTWRLEIGEWRASVEVEAGISTTLSRP